MEKIKQVEGPKYQSIKQKSNKTFLHTSKKHTQTNQANRTKQHLFIFKK